MYKRLNDMKKTKVNWSKTDICTIINVRHTQLSSYISEDVKRKVNFKSGQQRFKDSEVIEMLKDMFPAKNDAEIRKMIGY